MMIRGVLTICECWLLEVENDSYQSEAGLCGRLQLVNDVKDSVLQSRTKIR